ncbi:MAG: SurA N-terminal domain-containing protein [Verrucomicrobia bacterium]|nr:SurA N-terminal domain-containing protein [Verrucomicrobiota bacterium]
MFGTIRRHQTWLWVIIIIVIVISFVIYFSPDARWGFRGRGQGDIGTIDGRPVTVQEYHQAARETRLLYLANTGKWPDNDERARQMGFDIENESMMRLIRLAKVKQENIKVSDETVGTVAQMIVHRLLGPKGTLDILVREILAPQGYTEGDFERFIRNDAAMQQLVSVAGLAGTLVPPREVEASYREEHEEIALDGVFFNVSNYLSGVNVTETNVLAWYSNSMALFRVPEKMSVSYVEFSYSNFFAEVDKKFAEITNLNAQLEQMYLSRDTNSFKDEQGLVLSKAAALEKIKKDEREKGAAALANRKANDFAGELYDAKDHTVAGFEKFAASKGFQARTSEPFDEVDGPQDLKVPEAFARAAFALTNQEEAVSFQVAPGEAAAYVFAAKTRIPSYNPKYEDIRAKVVERYRLAEAQKMVRFAGLNFHSRLTNGLAQGKAFAQLVTESNLKLTPLPPVSRSVRELPDLPEGVYLPQLKNVAFSLQPGKASPYIPSLNGGYIIYLRTKLPIVEEKMRADLKEYAASMRMQRQNEAFGLWFRKQTERVDLPLTRQQQQAKAAAGKAGPKPSAK